MIKNIFLPEKIGSYFFFPQRILGFYIGKTQVSATQVYCKGNQRTVEKVFTALLPTELQDYQARVAAAIIQIIAQADKYDALYSGFPASLVFFKELSVPFVTREKIGLIYEYEIASQLPFSLDQAVLDFAITKIEGGRATILVCAVQKAHIAELLSMFEAAGVSPQRVVVDMLGLYGLYQQIPSLAQLPGNIALVHAGATIKVGFIVAGQLKFVRALPGFDQSQLQFTLTAFAQKTDHPTVDTVVTTGPFAGQLELLPTTPFPIEEIGKIPQVNVQTEVGQEHVLSLSVALPNDINQTFNLRKAEFSVEDSGLFTKQLATECTLMVLIFTLLAGNGYWQSKKVSTSISRAEKETIAALAAIPDVAGSKKAAEAVDTAQSKIEEQERIWFAFTSRTRSSFLSYLEKLSAAIDKTTTGLVLTKLSMTHDQIRLTGEVKDVPALVLFEDQLRSTGIGVFASPQEPKFDIVMGLK